MSVDHIIPRKICWELGLYKLITNPVNFRLAHKTCNVSRGHNEDLIPQKVLDKINEMRKNG